MERLNAELLAEAMTVKAPVGVHYEVMAAADNSWGGFYVRRVAPAAADHTQEPAPAQLSLV